MVELKQFIYEFLWAIGIAFFTGGLVNFNQHTLFNYGLIVLGFIFLIPWTWIKAKNKNI